MPGAGCELLGSVHRRWKETRKQQKNLGGPVMSMAQKGNGKRIPQDAEQKAKLEIVHD